MADQPTEFEEILEWVQNADPSEVKQKGVDRFQLGPLHFRSDGLSDVPGQGYGFTIGETADLEVALANLLDDYDEQQNDVKDAAESNRRRSLLAAARKANK